MHEESIAYWSKAVSRSEQHHCGRRLVVEVAADGDAPEGAARCQILRGDHVEGVLTLHRSGESFTAKGYLLPALDEMYRLDQPVSDGASGLVALARRLLDLNYRFPPELGVRHEHQDLSGALTRAFKKK